MFSKATARTPKALIAFGGTVLLVAALYFSPTVPRFGYFPFNYLFAIVLALMLPITLMSLTFSILSTWLRSVTRAVAAFILLPSALFSLFAFFQLIHGVIDSTDTSFEKIAELNGNNGTYRLYRTNGGATTSFGLVLRRERAILPGLRLVTVLRSYYPASDATLESLPNARGRLTVAPCTERTQGDTFEFLY